MMARFVISWLFFVAGCAWGVQLALDHVGPESRLLIVIQAAYIIWALYWGLPAVVLWWWKIKLGFGLTPRLWKLVLLPFFVLALGVPYSLLGGGVYQCLKTIWKISPRAQ